VDTFGPSGLLSRQAGSTGPSNTTLYTFDPRGNVSQRLSQSGSILSTDVYNAYGKLLSGNPSGDEFGFGGQAGYRTDQETGLCLLGERYYDPSAERFLTRDPAGYGGGMDLYAYCGDNPVNRMDPTGLDPGDPTDDGEEYLPASVNTGSGLADMADFQDKGMAQAGYNAGSFLAHATPGIGAILSANDAVSGCDVVSNSSLSTGQRVMAGVQVALAALPYLGKLKLPAIVRDPAIALGKEHLDLRGFARANNATWWGMWKDMNVGVESQARFIMRKMDEADVIHFNLNGVDQDLALGESMPTPRNPTWSEWELWLIAHNEQWFDKTIFHHWPP
jgi:RHS repeat-associated protein